MKFQRYFLLIAIGMLSLPVLAQDMKNKKEKDANGNIILEEDYYKDDEGVMVGSVKKERKYDNKNRKVFEITYFWDKEAKNWENRFKEEHEFTPISKTEKHYNWEKNAWIPVMMKTNTDDKQSKLKERTQWNWDTIANKWSETMCDKEYVQNDSLDIKEAYTRNFDTGEYWGTRREIRIRNYKKKRSVLIKDKWNSQQQKWLHSSRETSWNTGGEPEYETIEFYNTERKKWIPGMKVERHDNDNKTLYVWTENKWTPYKRTRKEEFAAGDVRVNLYTWDKNTGKWEKYASRAEATIQDESVYIYYLWDKQSSDWKLKQQGHEFNIYTGKQYNSETDKWEPLDRDTMIRFDTKYSFDISGWKDENILE